MSHLPNNARTKEVHRNRYTKTDHWITQTPLRILAHSFGILLIAFVVVGFGCSFTSINLSPRISRNILKPNPTAIPKCVMDASNREKKRFVILTERGTRAKDKHQRNLLPLPHRMGVWCHSDDRVPQTVFEMSHF